MVLAQLKTKDKKNSLIVHCIVDGQQALETFS